MRSGMEKLTLYGPQNPQNPSYPSGNGLPFHPSPPGTPGTSGPRYVAWHDPIEGSFSLEVPEGWRTEGGLFRASTTDVRGEVRTTSPDGGIWIFSGDRNIPPFSLPTQMGMSLGMPEGSWYSPGYGTQMLIMRYLPGPHFAQDYAGRMFSQSIPGFQIERINERQDIAQPVMMASRQAGLNSEVHAGELSFVGQGNGRQLRGYILAATTLNSMAPYGMEGGLWYVTTLYGYVAEASREAEARAVLVRMIESAQQNPDWARMQQGMTAQTSQLVRQTNEIISRQQQQAWRTMQETTDIINRSYHERQAAQDERSRHFGNGLMGNTDVRDETTNESWRVTNNSRYYWRKEGTDIIVGTDTYDSPGIDFRPVREF